MCWLWWLSVLHFCFCFWPWLKHLLCIKWSAERELAKRMGRKDMQQKCYREPEKPVSVLSCPLALFPLISFVLSFINSASFFCSLASTHIILAQWTLGEIAQRAHKHNWFHSCAFSLSLRWLFCAMFINVERHILQKNGFFFGRKTVTILPQQQSSTFYERQQSSRDSAEKGNSMIPFLLSLLFFLFMFADIHGSGMQRADDTFWNFVEFSLELRKPAEKTSTMIASQMLDHSGHVSMSHVSNEYSSNY